MENSSLFERIEFRVLREDYERLEKKVDPHLFPSIPEYVKWSVFQEVSAYLLLYRELVGKALSLPVGSVFTISQFCPAPPVILIRWFNTQVHSKRLLEFSIKSKGKEVEYERL
jgi:hypothetical protein